VANSVKTHEAWGLGIYSVFRHPNVVLTRAIEVPKTPGVRFHHMITVALDNLGEISNVIDDTGGRTVTRPRVTPKVTEFP
jgi:ribosomal protein S12